MKYNKTPKFKNLTKIWYQCQEFLKNNDLEKLDDHLMLLIFKISDYTIDNYPDDTIIEGTKIGVWKERAWTTLEKAGLLPPYYETNTNNIYEELNY